MCYTQMPKLFCKFSQMWPWSEQQDLTGHGLDTPDEGNTNEAREFRHLCTI